MKKKKEKQSVNFVIVGIIIGMVAFAAFVCFYNLGAYNFSNWDEAWYAVMTKEMLKSGQYIIPTWNYSFLFDKPPFYIWLSTLSSSIFGLSEFAVRLPSAISGFITLLLVMWFSYKRWGIVPAMFSLFALALNDIFIWRTRGGNLDATSTLFIFIIFLLIISKNKYKYPLLGLMFGLTYLTKASLVMYPFAIFVLYEIVFERNNLKKNWIEYVKLALIAGGLSGIWLLAGFLVAGQDFLNYYIFQSDQGAASLSIHNIKKSYLRYTSYSLHKFRYLFPIGIVALLFTIKRRLSFLIFFFAIALIVELSFSSLNNNWYLMPSMPFWALTIGYAAYCIITFFKRHQQFASIILVAIFAFYFYRMYSRYIYPVMFNPINVKQVQTAQKIKQLTKPDEVVVRLDNLFPAATYYSDRRVFSSPPNAINKDQFMSREVLLGLMTKGKINWIFGKKNDVESLRLSKNIIGRVIIVNDEEEILEARPAVYLYFLPKNFYTNLKRLFT